MKNGVECKVVCLPLNTVLYFITRLSKDHYTINKILFRLDCYFNFLLYYRLLSDR